MSITTSIFVRDSHGCEVVIPALPASSVADAKAQLSRAVEVTIQQLRVQGRGHQVSNLPTSERRPFNTAIWWIEDGNKRIIEFLADAS